jgi:hypothetical protein
MKLQRVCSSYLTTSIISFISDFISLDPTRFKSSFHLSWVIVPQLSYHFEQLFQTTDLFFKTSLLWLNIHYEIQYASITKKLKCQDTRIVQEANLTTKNKNHREKNDGEKVI